MNINSLNNNEKRRVEFCQSIIKACDEIENQKLKSANNLDNIAKDNQIFQNKLQKDIDLEMNNNDIVIEDLDNNKVMENDVHQ